MAVFRIQTFEFLLLFFFTSEANAQWWLSGTQGCLAAELRTPWMICVRHAVLHKRKERAYSRGAEHPRRAVANRELAGKRIVSDRIDDIVRELCHTESGASLGTANASGCGARVGGIYATCTSLRTGVTALREQGDSNNACAH